MIIKLENYKHRRFPNLSDNIPTKNAEKMPVMAGKAVHKL